MGIVYQGEFIRVVKDDFERAYLMPSVQVIPIKDDKVMMIREKRLIEGRSRWKFVSGFLDKPGLSKEQVAQEELMEEAGFEAKKLKEYFHYEDKHSFIIPITYFLAYDLIENKKPNPDGDVVEEIEWFSIEDLYNRVLEGEFDFLHEASVIMKLRRDFLNNSVSD